LSARYSARIKTIKDAGRTDVNAHLSLATARMGVREFTLRCSQGGLRPAQNIAGTLAQIVDAVRNLVLDWAIELEKKEWWVKE
jgi:hypothetical protein